MVEQPAPESKSSWLRSGGAGTAICTDVYHKCTYIAPRVYQSHLFLPGDDALGGGAHGADLL
eukprot:12400-Eustigmatos_ZCMA.PRE.1